jgi:phenylalanyl-tRNA synthetase alpha subunit
VSNTINTDFIYLTNELKKVRRVNFREIAEKIGISEHKMKNLRRGSTDAKLEDIEILINKFPELKKLDFENKHRFGIAPNKAEEQMSDEEMQAEIDRLNKEIDKLTDEVNAKLEEIDFEKESNRTLVRMINRLMDALEKNEKEGGLSEEEEAEIEREVEEFKRNKKK